MKIWKLAGWASALCLSATLLQAQGTNEVEELRRQLKQATDNFEKVMREQQQLINSLNQRLEEAQGNYPPALRWLERVRTVSPNPEEIGKQIQELEQRRSALGQPSPDTRTNSP